MMFSPPQLRPVRFRPRDMRPSDARSYWVYQRPTRTGPDTVETVLLPGATSHVVTGEPNSEAFYYVRAMSRCGVFDDEPIGPKLQRVAFDNNGDFIAPIPNAPTALRLTAKAGGEIEVEWGYNPFRQGVEPFLFKVYDALNGSATFDPAGAADYTGARSYSVTLGPYAHGTLVRVRVRSLNSNADQNTTGTEASIVADAQAPAAPGSFETEITAE